MRRALVMLVLIGVLLGGGPAAARAAVVVTREAGNLTLTSNGVDEGVHETVTLTEASPTTINVASPQDVQGDCGSGATVACAVDPRVHQCRRRPHPGAVDRAWAAFRIALAWC